MNKRSGPKYLPVIIYVFFSKVDRSLYGEQGWDSRYIRQHTSEITFCVMKDAISYYYTSKNTPNTLSVSTPGKTPEDVSRSPKASLPYREL